MLQLAGPICLLWTLKQHRYIEFPSPVSGIFHFKLKLSMSKAVLPQDVFGGAIIKVHLND